MRTENEEVKQKILEMRKKRRKRRLILLGIFLMLLLGALILAVSVRITDVTVTGSSRYSEDELISMIFKEDKDWNTVYALYKDKFKAHEDIPFIEKYYVKITGLHSAQITVYEKSLAGCIEYMGIYMYFDKDGVIVESSGELTPMVPLVTGLKFQNIVMYETLTVKDESIFGEILNLSQLLSGYGIQADRLDFDSEKNVTLYMGELKVILGGSKYMADKIAELHDMLPQLEGLSGTLYLNEYTPDAQNPAYPFVQNQG